jgi:hypothetical protein
MHQRGRQLLLLLLMYSELLLLLLLPQPPQPCWLLEALLVLLPFSESVSSPSLLLLVLPAERCGASAALRACLLTCSTQTTAPDCQTHAGGGYLYCC